MGLIDRVIGRPRKCPMHPRTDLPCHKCERAAQKSREQARGFKPESRTTYGPRGGAHTKRTGNRVDGKGNVWCGRCDCRVLNNRCTNTRCSSRR